jgi:group I intron endonuclease
MVPSSIPQDSIEAIADLWKCTGIYCLYVKATDDFYIGSTVRSFALRWANHIWRLRNNKHHSKKLQHIFNKYGPDSVELYVLEVVEDKERMLDIEQQYLDEYFDTEHCCNTCAIAGTRSGNKMTPEQLEKHRQMLTGRKVSEETRQKIAESVRKTHTPERRQQTINKIQKTYYGVLTAPDGRTFENITNVALFAQQHGLYRRALLRVCVGERPHHKGWTFKPYREEIHDSGQSSSE